MMPSTTMIVGIIGHQRAELDPRLVAEAESIDNRPVTSTDAALRIILVRPKIAGNIGAVARILANTGIDELVIVAPAIDPKGHHARKQACRAEHILDAARVVDHLADALHDVTFTLAASCRSGIYRKQARRTPRELADEARHRAGITAVVFGPEDFGLSNDDVLQCDATVHIPTHPDYESLNLSHAVMIIAYEWFIAGDVQVETTDEDLADGALVARLMDKFRDSLSRIGYLNPQKPDHLLMALRGVFGKARLTTQEAKTLMGLAQQIRKFADHGTSRFPEQRKRCQDDFLDSSI